jgi:hypothetical protein
MLDTFWDGAQTDLGEQANQQFIALTDPGSKLEVLATERGFREVISTPPDVGGRYSALTPFGLFPAALLGLDVGAFLTGAERMARSSGPNLTAATSAGMYLGAILGSAYDEGRDKVTFIADPELEPFGDWIEQLIAESSGKSGKGILPIVGEPPGNGHDYADDRILVYLRNSGELDPQTQEYIAAGLPVLILEMVLNERGFGEAFFQWEFGVAVACHLLGVNAFNQPNVQAAKTATVDLLKRYEKKGDLPKDELLWEDEKFRVRGDRAFKADTAETFDVYAEQLLIAAREKGSIGFLLYLPLISATQEKLGKTRGILRSKLRVATLHGYGPRYLHSTGQLHKGGANNAAYLVVTSDRDQDVEIPGFPYGFAVLQAAQAVGDVQALKQAGRTVLHVELKGLDHLDGLLSTLEATATQLGS